MANNDLKKLSRSELIEMLIAEMEENQQLRQQIEEKDAELQNRQIIMERAGSIAEAALQLNGVFEAAQAAAQQYVDSVEIAAKRQEELCRLREEATANKANQMMENAREYQRKAKAEIEKYRDAVLAQLEEERGR